MEEAEVKTMLLPEAWRMYSLATIKITLESDFDNACVNTVRVDSGEIVATRGMTQEERQRSLFRDGKKRKNES